MYVYVCMDLYLYFEMSLN